MKYTFDIWKIGDEIFAINRYRHNRVYGIHLTGPEPKTAHGIEFSSTYRKLITHEDYVRTWVFVYVRYILKNDDMLIKTSEGGMPIVMNKTLDINVIKEYDYDSCYHNPLDLYMEYDC